MEAQEVGNGVEERLGRLSRDRDVHGPKCPVGSLGALHSHEISSSTYRGRVRKRRTVWCRADDNGGRPVSELDREQQQPLSQAALVRAKRLPDALTECASATAALFVCSARCIASMQGAPQRSHAWWPPAGRAATTFAATRTETGRARRCKHARPSRPRGAAREVGGQGRSGRAAPWGPVQHLLHLRKSQQRLRACQERAATASGRHRKGQASTLRRMHFQNVQLLNLPTAPPPAGLTSPPVCPGAATSPHSRCATSQHARARARLHRAALSSGN